MFKKSLEITLVVLLMLVLAAISTYPLAQYFDQGIPYAPYGGPLGWNRTGDMVQLLFWFWLVKENFIGNVPFDSNPYEFNMLMAHETSGLNTIPLAFLYMLFSPLGDVTAYNCTIISSYVLTGLFMYLLVRLYTGSRGGALLAAIIFTFAPSRIHGVSSGHGYGFLFFLYPFILYFLEKAIRSRKIRYGVLSGVGLICLAMLEPHLIYYICVFLGVYIPVRIVALFPLAEIEEGDLSRKAGNSFPSWSTAQSILLIWGVGVAVIGYAQILFACRDQDQLVPQFFWWMLAIYPFIPVLLSLFLASVYQRLSPVSFCQGLAVEAMSSLPLYLALVLFGVTCIYRPVNTTLVVATLLVLAAGGRLVLLRHQLFSMVHTLVRGIFSMKKKVLPVIPVIASMGLIVFWIISSKVEKISSTIAGGGRTLRDVELFSSHLSDLFKSTSHVYFGIVPTVLLGCLFLIVFWYVLFTRKKEKIDAEAQLIRLFYLVVTFCCYVLALGIAFGKSSLYILFYHYFPFFNYPRVSDRIMVMVLFAGAVAVAFFIKGMQDRCKKRGTSILLALLLVIAMGVQLKDYNVFRPVGITLLDRGQDIYTYVEENIGDGLLLEIPLWPGDSHQSSLYQHYIMIDRVRRVNGYSPLVLTDYLKTVIAPLSDVNAGILTRSQYELLREMDVRFLTVHQHENVFPKKVTAYGPGTTVRRLIQSPYLELVDIDNFMHFKTFDWRNEGIYLFKVKEKVPAEADKKMNNWYEMPYFYGVNSRLHQQTGEIAEDSKTGKKVFQAREGKNRPGFLVYGPYDVYSPGEYRCYFTMTAQADIGEDIARVEVSSVTESGEQVVLAQREVKGRAVNDYYQKIPLDFSLLQKEKLEFRVFFYGKGEVRVDNIAVYKADSELPLSFLEAEKMVGDTGQLVFEEDASSGKVIEGIVGKSKKKDLVYGPNRIYSKGRYTARFYLRLKDVTDVNPKEVVARVFVTDGRNLKRLFHRNVTAGELNDNSFTAVEADLALAHDQELSFHVRFTNKVSLQLDGIEIIRQ